MSFKVIIAGSRDFSNYDLLKNYCNFCLLKTTDEIEIVCGMARGADLLGKRYAEEKGYAVKEFPADWKKYGKSAGPLRNEQMAEYADALIAFWGGKSRGTRNMILLAEEKGLKVRVYQYD